MKSTLIIGLATSSLFISTVSAMESMDGHMMQKDTMTISSSDTMMKSDKMMDMSKMSLRDIVKHCGYTWSKDRQKLATMAGIKNYRGTVKQNLMIRAYLLSDKGMATANMMKKENTMMKMDESKTMKKDESSMMKNDTMKKEDTMMKQEAGMYSPYSSSAVSSALSSGKTVYLFFAASWCPGCRSLDTSITGDIVSIPANAVIFKVDYDNSTDLKKQYGVTIQHTVVKLNSDASLAKKIVGPISVADIIK